MATADRGPRLHKVPLTGKEVSVYAGAKVGRALDQITEDMTLFDGVKLAQVLEAVYDQGLKDGRREVIEAVDKIKDDKSLKWRNPGQPAKKAAAKKAAAKKAAAKKAAAKKAAAKKAAAKEVSAEKAPGEK